MKTRVHNITGVREVYERGDWRRMEPKEQADYETARDMSGLEKAGVGFSRQYGRILESLPGMEEQDPGLYQEMSRQDPWSTAAGEISGAMASSLVPGGKLTQAVVGGIHGAATSPGNRLQGALFGAGGSIVGDVAFDASSRVLRTLKGLRTRDIPSSKYGEILESQGYQVTPGMRTGRKDLKNLDRRMLEKGGGAVEYSELVEHNQQRLNEQVAGAIGIRLDDTGEISDAALREFGQEVNRVYKDVTDSIGPVDIGEDLLNQLKEIPGLSHRLPDAGTVIEAKDLEKVRQSLSKRLKSPEWGDLAYDALEEVEGIYAQNVPANVAREFTDIRKRYRVWKALEKGQALTAGEVNSRSFASNMIRSYGRLNERDPYIEQLIQASEGLKRLQYPEGSSPTGESLKGLGKLMGEGAMAKNYLQGGWAPDYSQMRVPGTSGVGSITGRGVLAPVEDE